MKKIKLTQGKFALVDNEDYEWLTQWKWCAYTQRHGFRAARRCEGKTLYMHRAVMNPTASTEIDHLNNQRSNLRIATSAQNGWNRKSHKTHTSKFKGVYWEKQRNKWRSCITANKKVISLGFFSSEIKAAQAYDCASLKYHGDFGRQNVYND